jgi:hypothetical protein
LHFGDDHYSFKVEDGLKEYRSRRAPSEATVGIQEIKRAMNILTDTQWVGGRKTWNLEGREGI